MRLASRCIGVIAGLAAVFVACSAIALAVRQSSWAPIISVGWIPAVIVATWPGVYRRCLPPRRGHVS